MKIAIVGYGKMGKMVDQKATSRGHEIVLKISSSNTEDFDQSDFKDVEMAIEFTGPETAKDNVIRLLEWGVPVVSGSTGWLNEMDLVMDIIKKTKGTLFYASNFSISVNIFFEINKRLASLMEKMSGYDINIEETHHLQKKDAPSGTAISLANQIIQNNDLTESWMNEASTDEKIIPIISKRERGVPGTHVVKYVSPFDEIHISHIAHSRDAFALGAILAAEWTLGRIGYFEMKNMLNH